MSRLDAIRPAVRPRMNGRLMIAGPSGAGKTWSGLSIATVLAGGTDKPILVIDTERESALTYAENFAFEHLPWRPPFDPTELTETLHALADRYSVVVIDSLTHFWRAEGGTLDLADGKIGGWKHARPVQDRMVQALLAVDAHLIVCVRSKMEYLIEGGGKKVTKVGLAAIQSDDLLYEMNAAVEIDMEHRIEVTKSRTTALPVGRMFPAGHERKAAEDYAAWLAGGEPPATAEQVAAIVDALDAIRDADRRTAAKRGFVTLFGMPEAIIASTADDALAWAVDVRDTSNGGVADEAGS